MREYFLDEDSSFQQDLAPFHTSRKLRTFFEENRLEYIEWSGILPDLYFIENIHAIMKQAPESDCSTLTKLFSVLMRHYYHANDLAKMRPTLI